MKGTALDTFVIKKARIRQIVLYEDQELDAKKMPWPSVGIAIHQNGFWTGTIAYEDKKTSDGRMIKENALTWEEENISLVLLREPLIHVTKSALLDPPISIGVVHEITRREFGAIRANGTCEGMAPGNYFCAIEIEPPLEDDMEIREESEEN